MPTRISAGVGGGTLVPLLYINLLEFPYICLFTFLRDHYNNFWAHTH